MLLRLGKMYVKSAGTEARAHTKARTREALEEAITELLPQITQDNAKAWLGLRLGTPLPTIQHHDFRSEGEKHPEQFADLTAYIMTRPHQDSLAPLVTPHFQWRISGRSSPYLSMYCLCSISLSLSLCFR